LSYRHLLVSEGKLFVKPLDIFYVSQFFILCIYYNIYFLICQQLFYHWASIHTTFFKILNNLFTV